MPSSLIAALSLLGCSVDRCPEGMHTRFDQCVRLKDDGDSGAIASPDAGLDGADAGAGAETDGGCDGERMWSDGRCVLKEIYVDALDGDDTYPGTLQRPLKTVAKALTIAAFGQIVNFFEAREYVLATGDEAKPLVVPHGVTLRTRPDSRTTAMFVADGTQSLIFAGSATLDALLLTGFKSIVATNGEQHLTRISVSQLRESFGVSNDARLRCEGCAISGDAVPAGSPRTKPVVVASDDATLTLLNGSTRLTGSGACEAAIGELIRVVGASNLVLDRQFVGDGGDRAVYLETQGSVKLISTNLSGPCPGRSALVWKQPTGPAPTATLELDASTLGGVTLLGSMQSLRVRRCEFQGPFVIEGATSGTYDLGLPTRTSVADVGWNTLAHLAVSGSETVVSASGNKWQASLQGADQYGHYLPGGTHRVNAGASVTGPNFSLIGDGGSVELRL